jgi:hypothetical protein
MLTATASPYKRNCFSSGNDVDLSFAVVVLLCKKKRKISPTQNLVKDLKSCLDRSECEPSHHQLLQFLFALWFDWKHKMRMRMKVTMRPFQYIFLINNSHNTQFYLRRMDTQPFVIFDFFALPRHQANNKIKNQRLYWIPVSRMHAILCCDDDRSIIVH